MVEKSLYIRLYEAYTASRGVEMESLEGISHEEYVDLLGLIMGTMTSLNNTKTNLLNALHKTQNAVKAQPKAAKTDFY